MPRMDDLDPATRREVERAIGRRSSSGGGQRTRKRARPSTAGSTGGAGSWECECGAAFTTWAAADKHPAGPGHTRMTSRLGSPVTPAP